jgi:hypothetical protein
VLDRPRDELLARGGQLLVGRAGAFEQVDPVRQPRLDHRQEPLEVGVLAITALHRVPGDLVHEGSPARKRPPTCWFRAHERRSCAMRRTERSRCA